MFWSLCKIIILLGHFWCTILDGIEYDDRQDFNSLLLNNAGATLCKCVNRAIGTFLAGALGLGVHWIANQSGEKFKPIIIEVSVFLLGRSNFYFLGPFQKFFPNQSIVRFNSHRHIIVFAVAENSFFFLAAAAATFSRFIPTIKARFDYGAMIFILTFSLVSVSGYRVDELFELAHDRLSTIAIGTSLCILTTMIFCPVWAGNELHYLITNNMEKIAASLNGKTGKKNRI